MTALTVLVAVGAAVMFGWSTAAMHHGASGAPHDQHGLRGLLALLRHVVVQWRWITGMVASLLGLVLHALALRIGSLAVVQPLVVSGLVFSFAFRAALDKRLPSLRTTIWSALTAVGLSLFLVAAHATTGSSAPTGGAATVVLCVGVAAAAACWWTSTRARPSVSGPLLGIGAGVVFGLTAGTLKATTAEHGLAGAFTSWPLYTLLVLGIVGFMANQTAYRRAPLTSSLPALNVVNPLVALAYGAVAFHEKPAAHPATFLAELVSLVVVLTGVFFLGRQDASVEAPVTADGDLVDVEAERPLEKVA